MTDCQPCAEHIHRIRDLRRERMWAEDEPLALAIASPTQRATLQREREQTDR